MALLILTKISFAVFSGAIAGTDIKNGTVPRLAFVPAFPFFFLLKLFLNERQLPIDSITGVIAGLVIFLLARVVSGKKLGLADVWYSALIGMVLGPLYWYRAIAGACFAGAAMIMLGKKRQIPFIPCMAAGSVLMFFTGG